MRKAGLWGAIAAAVAVAVLTVVGVSAGHSDRPTMTTVRAEDGPCVTEC